ncbi:MAG: type II toxin-antitoxin system Phd/YefM family antitoxin [Kiritimatiellia bacterium]
MNSIESRSHSNWQLQEAKAKFSSVVKRAEAGEPQLVTRNGVPTVYVVGAKSFERLTKKSLSRKDVLSGSPCKDVELDLERQRDGGREVIL